MTEDLKLAAVAQVTIMDAQNLVDELERLRLAYAKQLGALSLILKAFSDLYLELTEKRSERKWLSKQIQKAEREADRQRMPSWFWRIHETEPVKNQLYYRARWLLEYKPNIHHDDLWDTLVDALTYSKLPIDPNNLTEVIERALNVSSTH